MTTSSDVIASLRTRYLPPEWYVLTEVANGTGYGRERYTYADAVAVNAYQSGKCGAEIHGFEVVTYDDGVVEDPVPTLRDARAVIAGRAR